jgi:hypothetical protein
MRVTAPNALVIRIHAPGAIPSALVMKCTGELPNGISAVMKTGRTILSLPAIDQEHLVTSGGSSNAHTHLLLQLLETATANLQLYSAL